MRELSRVFAPLLAPLPVPWQGGLAPTRERSVRHDASLRKLHTVPALLHSPRHKQTHRRTSCHVPCDGMRAARAGASDGSRVRDAQSDIAKALDDSDREMDKVKSRWAG